jgi:excisionase family DNA binding protein
MRTFKEVRDELETLVADLGLITIRDAAELRGVSRSAILQLIQRNRLTTETVLGKQLVYKKAVEEFRNERPGPAPNTIFRSRKTASDNA